MNLLHAGAEQPQLRSQWTGPAKSNFEEAVALAPRSADPHLGLARIYIYAFHNVGKAIAEMQEAQRLGFQPGPREMEEQARRRNIPANSPMVHSRFVIIS